MSGLSRISELSSQLSNQIAAGEVVERPAVVAADLDDPDVVGAAWRHEIERQPAVLEHLGLAASPEGRSPRVERDAGIAFSPWLSARAKGSV